MTQMGYAAPGGSRFSCVVPQRAGGEVPQPVLSARKASPAFGARWQRIAGSRVAGRAGACRRPSYYRHDRSTLQPAFRQILACGFS